MANNSPPAPVLFVRLLAWACRTAERCFQLVFGDPRNVLIKRLPAESTCAEIGVWKGDFSKKILSSRSPRLLHLIDPWKFNPEFPTRLYGGSGASSQADMDHIYEQVAEVLGSQPNVEIHRGPSSEMLCDLPDDSLDWIYIDGDHSYEGVLADLELAWQKVRCGGIVSGDDYWWAADGTLPVRAAVRQTRKQHRYRRCAILVRLTFTVASPPGTTFSR